MKKFQYILILLCLISVTDIKAQFDAHFTHYWNMLNFYNPAGAGATGKLHAFATYSNQLTGFTNNPKSMLINGDLPLSMFKGDHSAGMGILSDNIGMFTNQHLYLNYAYALKIFGGRLAIGAQVGMLSVKFDPKDLILENKDDPAIPKSAVDGSTYDLGLGVLFQHKYFYAGISALHLNAPLVEMGETNDFQIDPYYNFTAGGNIQLKNPLISIQPSVQVMTDFVTYRADITARGSYKYNEKLFFGGATYSPSTSVTFFAGMEVLNFTLSYGYELFTSGIGAKNGSHDIYLGYDIKLDLYKKGKNKHNSIRILQ
ncbi:MAG: PorP/SprF family type IX secretion system membrane protein [Bacteroidaceae bacterium]|nr:PorP/SprF family type IX secretion system membrane protein [Bacteroidaceae bacterium]MBQ3622301.1 PorP/SprF family type IX secretion system membrane protein [Bacteroidaceae bacterium]